MTGRGRPSRASIHQRLAVEVDELRKRFGGLPSPDEAEGIWAEIWYSEAHSSTAIEGNTLVLKEVEALLRDNRVVGHKERNAEALRRAAARGRLRAKKGPAGTWLSSQVWLQEYLTGRYSGLRQPRKRRAE
jgi:hypothetical protein